jgi:Fe-Mn family superoxide dismutase
MDKREFIKTGLMGVAGLASIPAIARSSFKTSKVLANVPELPYTFGSFGGFLSKKGLQLHHEIFVDAANELNSSLNLNYLSVDNIKDVLLNSHEFNSKTIHLSNTYLNHKIFFKTITPDKDQTLTIKIQSAITDEFGTFNNFKKKFEEAALSIQSEGWVWLVYKSNYFFVTTTEKDNNPFSTILPDEMRGYPILGLDMWEHAYKPDYENIPAKYVSAFWNYIDWNYVDKRYRRALLTKI